MARLIDITGKAISGEWGNDDNAGTGIPVLRTTNFTNNGVINYNNVVTRDIQKKDLSQKFLQPGDIILEKSGGSDKQPVGRVVYYDGEPDKFLFNNFTGVLRVQDKAVWYPRYVFYALYGNYAKGGTRRYENKTTGLHNLKTDQYVQEFAIQEQPLEYQQAVVAKLDKITELIGLRKQQLAKLDELVKSRFVELFGSMESKIHISEMCNVTGGYSFKSGDISDDGAIKILQIGNVYLDNVSWETTNYLPEGFDEKYSKFMLDEGDIVVALTRPIIQSLGNVKACIVKSSDLPCLLNQRVGRIVAKKEKSVFLEFIYGCLMTDDFTRYVESCSIGCSQPNISTKDIENYLIPNATYEEQKAYVEFKKQTDKSKLTIQQSLDKLELMKKALMQEYFG